MSLCRMPFSTHQVKRNGTLPHDPLLLDQLRRCARPGGCLAGDLVGQLKRLGQQNGLLQVGEPQVGPLQVGAYQVGPLQVGARQPGSLQVGVPQVGPLQVRAPQVGPLQVGVPQVDPSQVGVYVLREPRDALWLSLYQAEIVPATVDEMMAKVRDQLAGQVLYDPAERHSINLAATAAAILDANTPELMAQPTSEAPPEP